MTALRTAFINIGTKLVRNFNII